eukprot:m.157581 g.157581  ORF g.157581 m.157581 type:complete len:590 (-) comp17973_c0_seq5:156-1925(-)
MSAPSGSQRGCVLTVNEKEIKYSKVNIDHVNDVLNNTVCIFFDTETTGLSKGLTNPRKDEIIQMSLVACTAKELPSVHQCWSTRNGKPGILLADKLRPWSHTAIIRPYIVKSSGRGAELVHGITKSMTDNANYFFAEAVNFGNVIRKAAERRESVRGSTSSNTPVTLLFIAHNMPFDRWMLRYAFTLGTNPQNIISSFFPTDCEVKEVLWTCSLQYARRGLLPSNPAMTYVDASGGDDTGAPPPQTQDTGAVSSRTRGASNKLGVLFSQAFRGEPLANAHDAEADTFGMVRLVCAWNAWSDGATLAWLLTNAVVDPELSGRHVDRGGTSESLTGHAAVGQSTSSQSPRQQSVSKTAFHAAPNASSGVASGVSSGVPHHSTRKTQGNTTRGAHGAASGAQRDPRPPQYPAALPPVLYVPTSSVSRSARHSQGAAVVVKPNAYDAVIGASIATGKYQVAVSVTAADVDPVRDAGPQRHVVVDDCPAHRASSWRPKYADQRARGVRFLCRRMYESHGSADNLPRQQASVVPTNAHGEGNGGDSGNDTGVDMDASGTTGCGASASAADDEEQKKSSYDLWYILNPTEVAFAVK